MSCNGERADGTVAARTPDLTVVIVSYQCRELLLRCLASLDRDPAREEHEVIVIDNASSDGTPAAVRSQFPWVDLVDAGGNVGFSVGNNLGLRRAGGRHILLLNPDTVVPVGALGAAVREIDARPEVGMLGVKLIQENGDLDHACKRGFPTPLGALLYFTRVGKKRSTYLAGHMGADEEGYVDAVNGAFMLIRRDALSEVGPLDEDYWLYMEDLDWCYRFWQRNWKVFYWPGAYVIHVKGGSSGNTRSWAANYAFHRGMWVFYRKHYQDRYPHFATAAVWFAIWAKLAISHVRSVAAKTLIEV